MWILKNVNLEKSGFSRSGYLDMRKMCLYVFHSIVEIEKPEDIGYKCLNICGNKSFHLYIQRTNGYVQNVRTDINKLRLFDCISWILWIL